jgi:hypothetical protein
MIGWINIGKCDFVLLRKARWWPVILQSLHALFRNVFDNLLLSLRRRFNFVDEIDSGACTIEKSVLEAVKEIWLHGGNHRLLPSLQILQVFNNHLQDIGFLQTSVTKWL